MAERMISDFVEPFRDHGNMVPFGKKDGPTQFPTNPGYYDVGCLHPLDLRPSTLQEENGGRTSRIYEESGTLGKGNNKYATKLKFAVNIKGKVSEMYIQCVNPPMNVESTKSRVNNMKTLKWASKVENFLTKKQQCMYRHQLGNCSEAVSCEAWSGRPKSRQKNVDLYTRTLFLKNLTILDPFADDIGGNEIDIASVAGFGFNHIIVIGEFRYGMTFLDFPKHYKEDGELAWYEKNGIVYEYIMKPQRISTLSLLPKREKRERTRRKTNNQYG
ncbi:17209_t:CDS:2 [Funneliformis geosporum]|uniref:17209_t:CDS:1 n=1 Tax=Funneliformis geosporum TaxID=1117311 RepID=A0A9W4WT86_9GLOM|nr:17209_t:CDS:2 [Funneliformis geosporum]